MWCHCHPNALHFHDDASTTVGANPQMPAKEGIWLFGEDATAAIFKEFAQLHGKNVFHPEDAGKLTREQKWEALCMITLIKRKWSGRIKGRTCTDGRKQRQYIPKEETSSPTVTIKVLILLLLIDTYEGRDVMTADIVGAFLLVDMGDIVLIKFEGETMDIYYRWTGNSTHHLWSPSRGRRPSTSVLRRHFMDAYDQRCYGMNCFQPPFVTWGLN